MATRRKTYKLRGGDVYDVEEYPDGRYGARGKARQKKKKPTPEQMAAVNQANRAKICRRLLIEYFDAGDYFVTYTYKVEQRPKDMTVALKDLQKALRKLRPKYKKANTPFYWIRNIERGTKGAWHIHLVIKKTSGAAYFSHGCSLLLLVAVFLCFRPIVFLLFFRFLSYSLPVL